MEDRDSAEGICGYAEFGVISNSEDEEQEMSEVDRKALEELNLNECSYKKLKKERPVYKKGGHDRVNKK